MVPVKVSNPLYTAPNAPEPIHSPIAWKYDINYPAIINVKKYYSFQPTLPAITRQNKNKDVGLKPDFFQEYFYL